MYHEVYAFVMMKKVACFMVIRNSFFQSYCALILTPVPSTRICLNTIFSNIVVFLVNYYHHEYRYGFLWQILHAFSITYAFSSTTNTVVKKNVLFISNNTNVVTQNAWGPFLESPGNFSGPKSNIQIEI